MSYEERLRIAKLITEAHVQKLEEWARSDTFTADAKIQIMFEKSFCNHLLVVMGE